MVYSSRTNVREMLSLEMKLKKYQNKLSELFQTETLKTYLGNKPQELSLEEIQAKSDQITQNEEVPGEIKDLFNQVYNLSDFIIRYKPKYETMFREFNYHNEIVSRRLSNSSLTK